MAGISIQTEQCNRCGICTKVCPMGNIVFNGEDSFPVMLTENGTRCISCGHCEAACPEGALSVMYTDEAEASHHTGTWSIPPEQIALYMRSRRSIRHFRKTPIAHHIFEDILDIARFAPSAGNGQPISWIVVQDTHEVTRLTELAVDWMRHVLAIDSPWKNRLPFENLIAAWEQGHDGICRHAPHLVVAYTHESHPLAQTDGTIALTYFELALPAFGIGACWAGIFNFALSEWEPLQEAIGIPAQHIALGTLMVGYPQYKHHRIPQRNRTHVRWM